VKDPPAPSMNVFNNFAGTFIVAYGIISVKIKAEWYLGEAREYRSKDISISRN